MMTATSTLRRRSAALQVMIVEDDPELGELLARVLRDHGYSVRVATTVAGARQLDAERGFDVVVLDVENGLDVVSAVRTSAGAAQIVVMSAYAPSSTVSQALALGAFDFVDKPCPPERLLAVIDRAADKARLLRENVRPATGDVSMPLVELGPAMRRLHEELVRAAELDVPILIQGESGTGKEFVARAIHAASPRRNKPWLPVNCGAFRPELIDSEFFGHEKGAFTGATDRRLGLVEAARGGSILLDEVADLPLDAQVALLRFLELGEYRRVGGREILRSQVHIIAATNRDLREAVNAGRFREDLFFRLAVVSLRVPPLRERPEDVPVFVEHFLKLRGVHWPFSPEVMKALAARRWPGNLRELRNVVDRLLVTRAPAEVTPSDVAPSDVGDAREPTDPFPLELTLEELEKRHIARVLEHHGWNQTQASRTLGISQRTLYRKIREFGIGPG